jgi:hypothetical protein
MAQTITAKAGFIYTVSGKLKIDECPQCGVLHGVPVELVRYAKQNYPCFPIHCPNGHVWGYDGPSHEERAEQAEASAKAHRGAATRARNERDEMKARLAKGVCPCPCCNRHFKDVERHMATQHPDYHLPGEGT